MVKSGELNGMVKSDEMKSVEWNGGKLSNEISRMEWWEVVK